MRPGKAPVQLPPDVESSSPAPRARGKDTAIVAVVAAVASLAGYFFPEIAPLLHLLFGR
jgi:hypothetical protein